MHWSSVSVTASTFEAGIMSGLRRLFQTARERNSLTWMDIYWQGGLYASQSGRGLLTVVKAKSFFSSQRLLTFSICCAICADRDGYSRVCVFPAGFGSNFRIMVGSASGPGSTFKAFLGSSRVRVPLSNKIRVRVGSAQHIYGSLRVRVRIFGPVKTSNSKCYGVAVGCSVWCQRQGLMALWHKWHSLFWVLILGGKLEKSISAVKLIILNNNVK